MSLLSKLRVGVRSVVSSGALSLPNSMPRDTSPGRHRWLTAIRNVEIETETRSLTLVHVACLVHYFCLPMQNWNADIRQGNRQRHDTQPLCLPNPSQSKRPSERLMRVSYKPPVIHIRGSVVHIRSCLLIFVSVDWVAGVLGTHSFPRGGGGSPHVEGQYQNLHCQRAQTALW